MARLVELDPRNPVVLFQYTLAGEGAYRDAAEYDAGRSADLLVHLEDDGRADNSVGPGLTVHYLVVAAAGAGPGGRQLNRREQLVLGEDVLARRIQPWQDEEV